MLPLTINLLTFNNAATIETTLGSILPLGGHIIVGDLGSTDNTIALCEKKHIRVIKLSLNNDRSQARNHLLKQCKTDWYMWLEPWEYLYGKVDVVKKALDKPPDAYRLQIINNNLLIKQIRLWHRKTKKTFVNPVFETLAPNTPNLLDNIFIGSDEAIAYPETDKLLDAWKTKSPQASTPYYYEACLLFAKGKYQEFTDIANHYLFLETKDVVPVTMIRYYIAMEAAYIQQDVNTAIKYTAACLAANPLLAECWCLLGDIHYWLLKQYNKAKEFYENALILGAKRRKDDLYPCDMSKYQDHPQQMLTSCIKIVQQAHWLVEKY